MLLPGATERGGTVLVGLSQDVHIENAPWPRNESEKLLFRLFYETLLRVDCTGRVAPALALSWRSEDRGRAWLFTLREEARFWDGSPVTAADVVASLQRLPVVDGLSLPGGKPVSMEALDDRRLRVRFAEPRSQVPRELAELAVARERDFSGWPLGSGTHRPSAPAEEVVAGNLQRVITAYPVSSRSWTVLRFALASHREASELLDEGVDLLVTQSLSPDAARAWPEFTAHLLPWESVYVLVSPSMQHLRNMRLAFPASRRDALARDVLQGTARGASPPAWWESEERCSLAFSPGMPALPETRIAYPQDDPQARALAERIVGLSVEPLHAEALSSGDFAASLRKGDSLMYVLALPNQPGSPCGAVETLSRRAPWMFRGWGSRVTPIRDLSLQEHLLPLVETRSILMARQGLVGVELGPDGTLWLDRVGWSRSGESP